jgi:hypothetical protein
MKTAMQVRCVVTAIVFSLGAAVGLATDSPQSGGLLQPVVETSPSQHKPVVQIAILLDTSGSMSGLIDQTRTELWSIVNEFLLAEQGGRRPEIQVALYEYGNSGLSSENGWVRQILPLTTDLDRVSEELFALKTNGGDEYCGWVIREATQKLAWSVLPEDLKVIFIAGNEPFTQGPVDYRDACKAAIGRGVIVNTIHCGSEQEGIEGKWRDGALLADGRHLTIDHNRQIVHVPASQDREIEELSVRLNRTYLPFGSEGRAAQERQVAQDNNAASMSPQAGVGRALTKASAYYTNSSWDLVDAVRTNQVKLDQVEVKDLPENMQQMNAEQRGAYVTGKAEERAEIQARIRRLNAERNQFIADQTNKQTPHADTLGSAVKQAVREQAAKKNYTFKPVDEPSNVGGGAPDKK